MKSKSRSLSFFALAQASVVILSLALAGCSSDSPSEPRQQPSTPPGTTPPSSTYAITVGVSQSELQTGSDEPALVTISVRRADNGQAPANNTTIVVTTSLGDFGSQGSGVQSVALALIGGQAQLNLFAGGTQGTAIIRAQLEGSVGQAAVAVRGSATFFLSYVQPNTGSPDGGDQVTIVGGGFNEPVRVTFGGVVAQVLGVSFDRITVRTPPATSAVPAGTTLAANVQVTVNLNETDEASDALAGGFVYVPGGGGQPSQPLVFSVSPATGVNEGGTRVTITGTGFQSPVQVIFGTGTSAATFSGVEATIESVSATQIVLRTPAATGFGQNNQNAQVAILVRNLNTGFTTISQAAYRYGSTMIITALQPSQIVFDSQATVTISGQGFEAPVSVNLGGIPATVLSVSGTQVIVRAGIPAIGNCQDVVGSVQVVNINSGASDLTDDGNGPRLADFVYRAPRPVVTGVSPASGTGNGGTNVIVTGQGFDDPLRVQFGGAAGSVISVNAAGTSVTVQTPSFAEFDEVACDDNADGTSGMRFVRTTVDVDVVNLITGCEADTFTGGFAYIPTDTSCRGDQGAVAPQCNDGIDNDGDTLIDFPADPGCTSETDTTENG